MNKCFFIATLLLSCLVSFIACNKPEQIEYPTDDYVEICLNAYSASAEIVDEPTRASSSQIFAVLVGEHFNGNRNYYCYGVFNSLNDVKLKLNKNRTYDIFVAMYWDFFSKYYFQITKYTTTNEYSYINSCTNKFVYIDDNNTFFDYRGWYKTNGVNKDETFYEGAMLYGEIKNYTPNESSTCSIALNRNDSELLFSVEGLDDGELICKIEDTGKWDNITSPALSANNNSWTQTFSHKRYTPIWDVMSFDKTQYCRIVVDYIPNNGEIIKNLWVQKTQFTKGMRKKILLKLSKEDPANTSIGLNFTFQEDFVDEAEQEYEAKY